MKEKIKKAIKPFLIIIIAGFIVSFLYISLANQNIKEETKRTIKLPEISGYDYSDLEDRISDLEGRIDNLESQVSDLDGRIDDNESNFSDLESQTQRLKRTIDDLDSRINDLEW